MLGSKNPFKSTIRSTTCHERRQRDKSSAPWVARLGASCLSLPCLKASRLAVFAVLALLVLGVHAPRSLTQAQSLPPASGNYQLTNSWDPTHTTLPQGLWRNPAGLDVLPAGEILVTDASLRRVEVLAKDGSPIRQFGAGNGPDSLVHPGHIAGDAARDRIYVCDPGAARLSVFRVDGSFVEHWPDISGISGVAIAPDGRVLVSDAGLDRVRVFQPDGLETGGWGGTGEGPQELDRPGGLDITADGRIWVIDRGNERLVSAALDGAADQWVDLDDPGIEGADIFDISIDGDTFWLGTQVGLAQLEADRGRLLSLLVGADMRAVDVSTQHGMWVTVVPDEGRPGVWSYRYNQGSGDPQTEWSGDGLVPGYFDGIETLSIGADGMAYLSDIPDRIQRLDLNGNPLLQIESPAPEEAFAAADGRTFLAAGDSISAFAPDGTPLWSTRLRASPSGLDSLVVGLAWDAVHDQVVALEASSKKLYRLSASGEIDEQASLRVQDLSNAVWSDLAVAPDGRVLALDSGHQKIMGWDMHGRPVLELDLPPESQRFDLAPDDSLMVLGGTGWAHKLAQDGAVQARWDARRLELGGESRPVDIAVDSTQSVYIADRSANVVSVFGWDPNALIEAPPEVEEGCEIVGDKRATPAEVGLGDPVTISLTIAGACAAENSKVDLVILIGSGFEGGVFREMRRTLEKLVSSMDPAQMRIAIGGERLSSDPQLLRRQIRRLSPDKVQNPQVSDAAFSQQLMGAEQELWSRRGRADAQKIVLAALTGDLPRSAWSSGREAGKIQRRGGTVYALGVGRVNNDRFLKEIASSPAHVFKSRAVRSFSKVFLALFEQIHPSVLFQSLELVDVLPPNMRYVPGSARPPADQQGDRLIWRFSDVAKLGLGVRFQVVPNEAGLWPTNVEAFAEYIDAKGEPGRFVFPIPQVRVLAPPSPTPSPEISPTVPPSPTNTLEPTVIPSPVPSQTPAILRPLFLPILFFERCDPESQTADIALVIDTSASMGEAEAGAARKIDSATTATRGLLDRIQLVRDQATIISFNSTAEVLAPLGSSRQALDLALDSMELSSGTAIDQGLNLARLELVSPRHLDDNNQVLILLTDGQAMPDARAQALVEAASAKAAGITIFTIGLGRDIDTATLRKIASAPELYYPAPSGADLESIYAQIVQEIPCP